MPDAAACGPGSVYQCLPDFRRKFTHDPLPQNHLRLLRYESQFLTTDVSLVIDIFSKDAAPPYVALSHRWGPAGDERELFLNSGVYRVRNELYKALRALHSTYCSNYVWIDALCINQGDIQERNEQVGMMDDIFRRANKTIVWLGQLPGEFYPRDEMPVNSLSEQEYWSRTWIVQEILVSGSVTVHAQIDWVLLTSPYSKPVREKSRPSVFTASLDEMHHALRASYSFDDKGYMSNYQGIGQLKRRNASLAMSLLQTRSLMRTTRASGSSMYFLLSTYKSTECADPRDKIFALVGLLKPDDGFRKIFPDYNLSHEDVIYQALAEFRQQDTGRQSKKYMLDSCRILLDIFNPGRQSDWAMQCLESAQIPDDETYRGHKVGTRMSGLLRNGDVLVGMYRIAFEPPCQCELRYTCGLRQHRPPSLLELEVDKWRRVRGAQNRSGDENSTMSVPMTVRQLIECLK